MTTKTKLKRGDKHPIKDLFYWGMQSKREYWVTEEHLKSLRKKAAARIKDARDKNPLKTKEFRKKYYYADLEKSRLYLKEWRLKNLKKRRSQQNSRNRFLRKTDPLFLLKCRIRCRTSLYFKRKQLNKNSDTAAMIGCSWEFLQEHIEQQFVVGMNWGNRSSWHIDHIVPLASAETEERLIELCHYTNLQPLWAQDNLSKGSKVLA
jgi:hypothetical protein